MNNQQQMEVTNLILRLAKLIGYDQAQRYYERVYGDAMGTTRYSFEYIEEKLKYRISGETLKECY